MCAAAKKRLKYIVTSHYGYSSTVHPGQIQADQAEHYGEQGEASARVCRVERERLPHRTAPFPKANTLLPDRNKTRD